MGRCCWQVTCAPNGKLMTNVRFRGDREGKERAYTLHETEFGEPQFIHHARYSQGISDVFPLLGKIPRVWRASPTPALSDS